MTIAHEASTGIDVASSALGSTSSTIPYVGVAAGRMALLFIAVQPNTATFGADPSGWTKLGEKAGGADPHPSPGVSSNSNKIGVWYKTLTGSETGNVVVGNTGGDSAAGCMSSYSTTTTWNTPTFVSGDDNVHEVNRSVTCDSWTVATGDVVISAFSSDRGATTAITAQTLAQSGATFDTVTNRNKRLSNTSNDCSALTFDAAVLTGSTGALTATFAQAVTQCGPALAIRLRESAPAATNAPAGNAAATGTAHDASTLIGAAATHATAVAAALAPSLSVRVSAECATGTGTACPAVFTIPSHPAGPRITATSPRGRIGTSTTPPITSTSPRGWL